MNRNSILKASENRAGGKHFPGFDGIRLVAAIAVILTHSFTVLSIDTKSFPGSALIQLALAVGHYGVYAFFVMSGFLLARSLTFNPAPVSYAVNRALRILPAFIFYSLLMGLFLGPVLSRASIADYFSDPAVYKFLRFGIDSISSQWLPHVFVREGSLSGVINGSLWTLSYEAISYLILLVFWSVLRSPIKVAFSFVILAAASAISPKVHSMMASVAYLLPYFAGGVVMSVIYGKWGVNRIIALVCAAVFLVSCFWGNPAITFAVVGPYLVVFLGERPNFLTKPIAKIGDISYGMYIWGWPVQQTIYQLTGDIEPMLLFVLAVPVTAVFAFVSFHAVEKPAMNMRRPMGRALQAAVNRGLEWAGPSANSAIWGARIAFWTSACVIVLFTSFWWYLISSTVAIAAVSVLGAVIVGLADREFREFRGRWA